MIVLVDGYNFIKGIFPHRKGFAEECRQHLLRLISQYRECRHSTLKEVIIVFDGGLFSRATREVHGGVSVIFSGRGRSADDWIVEYVDRHRGHEFLVVTNDRQLSQRSKSSGAETMKIDEFDLCVKEAIRDPGEGLQNRSTLKQGSLKKFDRDDVDASEELDLLMEQASIGVHCKDDDDLESKEERNGEPNRLSKKEKKKRKILKKL